jgi:hypothetical protein
MDTKLEYSEAKRCGKEFLDLEYRLHQIWKKLVNKSLIIAKNNNLKITILDVNDYATESKEGEIIIRRNGEEIDASDLLALSEAESSSLYNDYYRGLKRYDELKSKLEKDLE